MKIFKITTNENEIKLFETPTQAVKFIKDQMRDWPYSPEIHTQNLYYYAKHADRDFFGFKFELYDLTEILQNLEKKLNNLQKTSRRNCPRSI